MLKTSITLMMAALLLVSCGEKRLEFSVRYKQVNGLKKGDRVISANEPIGVVEKVTYTDQGDYLVDVSLAQESAQMATDHSQFFIAPDPDTEGQMALEMVQAQPGGNPLQTGAVVQGTTRFSAMFSRLQSDLTQRLAELRTEFNHFLDSLQRLSESEQIKKLEEELDRILADLQNLSDEMKQQIETEILPRIKEQMEALRQRLKGLGREKELDPLEEKVDRISSQLRV